MIRVLTAANSEDLELQVNEVMANKAVFATQTHITVVPTHEGTTLLYTAIVFFKDLKDYNRS